MRVQFPEREVEVAAGSLLTHPQSQHGMGQWEQGGVTPTPPGEAQAYRASFPKLLARLRCPVKGCLGGATNRTNLWVHFVHRHIRDTIVILN